MTMKDAFELKLRSNRAKAEEDSKRHRDEIKKLQEVKKWP